MVLGEKSHGIQASLIVFQSLLMMSYLIYVKPFSTRSKNLLNIHNEIYLLVIATFFIIWTDAFEMKHDEKYTMGYIPIALCLLYLIVNLSYAFYTQLYTSLRRCI